MACWLSRVGYSMAAEIFVFLTQIVPGHDLRHWGEEANLAEVGLLQVFEGSNKGTLLSDTLYCFFAEAVVSSSTKVLIDCIQIHSVHQLPSVIHPNVLQLLDDSLDVVVPSLSWV